MLIELAVTALIVVLMLYLVRLLPLDARMRQLVRAIVVILGILYLLRYLTI